MQTDEHGLKVVVFRHVPFEDLGHIRTVLGLHAIAIEYADLYRDGAEIPERAIANAAGLIFMGGPMSANDDLPYLREERRIIAAAAGRGQPILGVCLGAQLLAAALGGRVYRNPVKEIGWYEIELAAEAADDPLFSTLRGRECVFHWHGETFDPPPGAVRLAGSDACRNQAFRAAPGIYGLQFHLEVTPEMILDWCSQDANCGDVRELSEPIDAQRHSAQLFALAQQVFGRWSALLETAQVRGQSG